MRTMTFQILEGVDRGRVFRGMPPPVTIGREEGNLLRLNDERVSRFHAKVQIDNEDIILTDLESTNGTRVNGSVVQIRRLRVGDRINVGRSLLLFGSNEEIVARMSNRSLKETEDKTEVSEMPLANVPPTVMAQALNLHDEEDFNVSAKDDVTLADGNLFIGTRALPPLPQKMTPAQAARFTEILDFFHRGLCKATENIKADEEKGDVVLTYSEWQKVQAVQMLLARYLRAIAEPDSLGE